MLVLVAAKLPQLVITRAPVGPDTELRGAWTEKAKSCKSLNDQRTLAAELLLGLIKWRLTMVIESASYGVLDGSQGS